MIVVAIFGSECVVDAGVWTCSEAPSIAGMLNAEEALRIEVTGGYAPDLDMAAAAHAAQTFDGAIIDRSQHRPPPYESGRTY